MGVSSFILVAIFRSSSSVFVAVFRSSSFVLFVFSFPILFSLEPGGLRSPDLKGAGAPRIVGESNEHEELELLLGTLKS